jgi:hypothetical protein
MGREIGDLEVHVKETDGWGPLFVVSAQAELEPHEVRELREACDDFLEGRPV